MNRNTGLLTTSLAPLLARLPGPKTERWPEGERFAVGIEHGSMMVEHYVPIGRDTQQPHERDELYVIVAGSGMFECNGVRKPFQSGDVLFVPARAPHRFVEFSEDFATWAIFWGPIGGEAATLPPVGAPMGEAPQESG